MYLRFLLCCVGLLLVLLSGAMACMGVLGSAFAPGSGYGGIASVLVCGAVLALVVGYCGTREKVGARLIGWLLGAVMVLIYAVVYEKLRLMSADDMADMAAGAVLLGLLMPLFIGRSVCADAESVASFLLTFGNFA